MWRRMRVSPSHEGEEGVWPHTLLAGRYNSNWRMGGFTNWFGALTGKVGVGQARPCVTLDVS